MFFNSYNTQQQKKLFLIHALKKSVSFTCFLDQIQPQEFIVRPLNGIKMCTF